MLLAMKKVSPAGPASNSRTILILQPNNSSKKIRKLDGLFLKAPGFHVAFNSLALANSLSP